MEASLVAELKTSCLILEINVQSTFPFRLLFPEILKCTPGVSWSDPCSIFFEVFTFSFLPPEILISKIFLVALQLLPGAVHPYVADMPFLLSGDSNFP